MSMRKTARWMLITVLLLDAAFAVAFFGGRSVVFAQGAGASGDPAAVAADATDATAAIDATGSADPAGAPGAANATDAADATDAIDDAENAWSAKALEALGRELTSRAEELDRRETELAEARRGAEVLALAGLDRGEPEDAPEPAPASPAGADGPAAEDGAATTSAGGAAFQRLQKAYENMEPATAATALQRLAARDRDAVVQLLLGWQPRVSGAILDALTQSDPELAADLSYEIWKISGGKSGS